MQPLRKVQIASSAGMLRQLCPANTAVWVSWYAVTGRAYARDEVADLAQGMTVRLTHAAIRLVSAYSALKSWLSRSLCGCISP